MKATDLRDRLGCDGLVPAIAAGRAREGSWIALEPPDASTLRHMLSVKGPVSLPRSLAILRPVATALDAGRAHGLVCDSLTADTVLVSGEPGPDERGHLTDLGPVWAADVRPGRLLGDPTGLAPEEIRGAPPSPASNVYALAALLVRCLTGTPPFNAPTRAGVLSGHLFSPPPHVCERVRGASSALDDLIASALAKDPRERPASAGELIDRAARTLAGSATPGSVSADRSVVPAAAGPPAPVSRPVGPVEPEAPPVTPRPVTTRWAPSPTAIRAMRRVAVIVPAVSLTVLAVFVLHSGLVTRPPAPTSAEPASGRQLPKSSATTATLRPIQDSGGRPMPTGHIDIAADGGRRQLTVAAANLPPERSHPRQAYAVWLFNSRRDAALLGFVVPPVGQSGRFESHRDLSAQAGRYREIVVTLESANQSRPEGRISLRGRLP